MRIPENGQKEVRVRPRERFRAGRSGGRDAYLRGKLGRGRRGYEEVVVDVEVQAGMSSLPGFAPRIMQM